MPEVSQEQIDAWKAQHKNVWSFKCEDKICYLKKPDRKIISYASVAGMQDPMAFNEIIIKECWLGGDEDIKTDDDYFMSLSAQLAELTKVKHGELVKL